MVTQVRKSILIQKSTGGLFSGQNVKLKRFETLLRRDDQKGNVFKIVEGGLN